MSPREEDGFASKRPDETASFRLMGIYTVRRLEQATRREERQRFPQLPASLGRCLYGGLADSVETGGRERPDLSLQADAPKKSPRAARPLLAGFAERRGGSTLFLPLRMGIDAAPQP